MRTRAVRWLVAYILIEACQTILATPFPSAGVSVALAQRQRTARSRRRLAAQYLRQGQLLLIQGQYAKAIHALSRSFSFRPSGLVLLTMGQCYELSGQLEDAKRIYAKLLSGQTQGVDREAVGQRLKSVLDRLKPSKGTGKPGGEKPPVPTTRPVPTEPVPTKPVPKIPIEGIGDKTENLGGDTENLGGDLAGDGDSTTPTSVEVTGLMSGWYKTVLNVYPGQARSDGPTDVVKDSLEFRNRLLLRLDVRYGATFQGFASVVLDHVVREQPLSADRTFWLFNGRYRAEFEVNVPEAFLTISKWKLDIRVGMLRVAWGKCDFQSPNDVINPWDQRNPLLEESELVRLPVLGTEISLNLSAVTLDVVWQPLFRPDKISLYGSNFGLIGPQVQAPIRGLVHFISGVHDSSLTTKYEEILLLTSPPPQDPRASSVGLRATVQIKGVDLGAYYHYGWNTLPLIQFNPTVSQLLAANDWSQMKLQNMAPLLALADSGMSVYRTTYLRRHHAGAEMTATVGSFVLRAEAGYDSQRIFFDQQLQGHARGTLAVSVNAEYQHSVDRLALLEVDFLRILDAPSENLLFYKATTLGVGGLLRWSLLRGDLIGEVRALIGVMPWSFVVRPSIRYKLSKRWSIYASGLVLGGETLSLGSFYDRNDMVIVGATLGL